MLGTVDKGGITSNEYGRLPEKRVEQWRGMERNDFENIPVRNADHLKREDADRLPLLLRNMVDMAEELFGARDESFSVTRIAFWEGRPTIHFPKGYEGKEIDIWLQIVSKDDMDVAIKRARYQLAHETVHLLSPVCRNKATYLEEGVACYFAEHYVKSVWNDCWHPGDPEYERALRLVKALVKEETENNSERRWRIKDLRTVEDEWRKFGDISEEDLKEAFPRLEAEDAHLLTSLFIRDEG